MSHIIKKHTPYLEGTTNVNTKKLTHVQLYNYTQNTRNIIILFLNLGKKPIQLK